MTRKIFVLGAPRSGTTLLYATLASHPNVMSMFETGLFELAVPCRLYRRAIEGKTHLVATATRHHPLNIAERLASMAKFRRLAGRLGLSTFRSRLDSLQSCADLIKEICKLAGAQGRSVWIEKTPNHLFYVDLVQKIVPDAEFVHIVRDGQEVIASCLAASLLPASRESWTFCQGLPWFIGYWNTAVNVHLRYLGAPNHRFILYEDFVADEAKWRDWLFTSIGCDPSRFDAATNVEHIADLRKEPWKVEALTRRVNAERASSFARMFGRELQERIAAELHDYSQVAEAVRSRTRCEYSGTAPAATLQI